MRKVKFISLGFPDENQLIAALNFAKTKACEMSIGEKKQISLDFLQTTLKIQDNNDILLIMIDTSKDNG